MNVCQLKCGGVFHAKIVDPITGRIFKEFDFSNLIPNAALDALNGGTVSPATALYCGLITGPSATISATDTAASHAGWTENVSYGGGSPVRQTWTHNASSGGIITTSSACVFTLSSTVSIQGGFLSTVSTASSTSGLLFAEALFSGGAITIPSGQQLQISYTYTLASM